MKAALFCDLLKMKHLYGGVALFPSQLLITTSFPNGVPPRSVLHFTNTVIWASHSVHNPSRVIVHIRIHSTRMDVLFSSVSFSKSLKKGPAVLGRTICFGFVTARQLPKPRKRRAYRRWWLFHTTIRDLHSSSLCIKGIYKKREIEREGEWERPTDLDP